MPECKLLGCLRFVVAVVMVFSSLDVDAQEGGPLHFERLNLDDGLVSPGITSLLYDNDGFLWIGTNAGVSRYDGSVFTNYVRGESPCDLSDDHVSKLALTPDSNICLTTSTGWSVFDKNSTCFTSYARQDSSGSEPKRFYDVLPDTGRTFWLAGHGALCRFNANNDVMERFPLPVDSLRRYGFGNELRSLRFDPLRPQQILIGIISGICSFDTQTGDFNFDLPKPSLDRPSYTVSRLRVSDSTIWMGTWGNGMLEYDRARGVWRSHISDEGKRFIDDNGINIPWDVAHDVRKVGDKYWIAYRRGLGLLCPESGEITIAIADIDDPTALGSAVVTAIEVTQSGETYVATDNGLHRIGQKTDRIRRFDPLLDLPNGDEVMELYSGNEDKLYFCARLMLDSTLMYSDQIFGGLTFFNTATGKFRHAPLTVNSKKTIFYSAALSPSGGILLSDWRDLYLLDGTTLRIKKYGSLELQEAMSDLKLFRPKIAFSDNGVLFAWDHKNVVISPPAGPVETLHVDDYSPGYEVASVLPSHGSGSIVWMGLDAYVWLHGSLKKLDYDIVPGARITSVEEIGGDIWIGTMGSGVYQYQWSDGRLNMVRNYTRSDGLRSNGVTTLARDSRGNIWATLNSGICRINVESGHVRSYSSQDGLALSFIDEPAVGRKDGAVLFDDRRFWYLWSPVDSLSFEGKPYVQSIEVDDSIYFDLDDEVLLGPLKNSVFVRMGVIDHQYGLRDRVEYFLEGFDEEWQLAGNDRIARYTNLPPGSYVFKVKAINPDGLESKIARARFVIRPAIYQTVWFFPTIIILFCLAIYLLYRQRLKSARQREMEKVRHDREVAELELKALRSQMNPHFMFNSLNSIKNYILKTEPAKASEYLSSFAHLIRLTLQNSRERSISLRQELEALVLYVDLERLRFREGFEFNCTVGDHVDLDRVEIPPLILQPYVENAIWHGLLHKEEHRQLNIDFRRENGSLLCTIDDNGIGRKRASEIKSKSATHYKSMGMGITRDRLDILNRLDRLGILLEIIDKENSEGQPAGTSVKIKIPYESAVN